MICCPFILAYPLPRCLSAPLRGRHIVDLTSQCFDHSFKSRPGGRPGPRPGFRVLTGSAGSNFFF